MMNRASRYGTTISSLVLAVVLAGCATGQSRESIFGSPVDHKNIGIATKAQAALAANQFTTAIELAERAVENTPTDAGFRSLLGNCYFAAGRFASAEAAYRDSLSLIPSQPQVVLKLALVQIAQGKKNAAMAVLEHASNSLDPADYGLAMALAGRPDAAIAILNQAARMPAADGRVRQNLALAYGLSGDWTMARVVAAQDIAPDELDSRIQQWMAMATPTRPSDQVAALTGVTPSGDPGQPQRLALNSVSKTEALAELVLPLDMQMQPVEPVMAEVPAAPPPAIAAPMPSVTAPPQPPVQAVAAYEPVQPVADPVVQAAQSLFTASLDMEIQVSSVEQSPEPEEAEAPAASMVTAIAPKAERELPTRFDAPTPASFVAIADRARRSARSEGASYSVVQLGAYSSPERVSVAWDRLTKQFPALASYTPMKARFDSLKGPVWRLSIKGFATQREAISRCEALQNRGGSCFVRKISGDSPVQFASR